MNQAMVDKIAQAVLYEGYILYPYRPSVKNRHRWTFGGLYPEAYSLAQKGSEPWIMQTECLVQGTHRTKLELKVRFLHLTARTVGELLQPLAELPSDGEPPYRAVESLQIGEKRYQTWQEAMEQDIELDEVTVEELLARPEDRPFAFSGRRELEPLRMASGSIVGILLREQHPLAGLVELSAEPKADGLFKLTVRILNRTPVGDVTRMSRDDALMRSMVSTHTILGVRDGQFVSLMDPPVHLRPFVADCRNVGTWPVLVGQDGETDTMLSSPIILYDYPQIAPQSPGDLFDGTEIDEILTLRIMTLTDQEKQEMIATDERARELLSRTESLAREQLMKLHGTIREIRPIPQGGQV